MSGPASPLLIDYRRLRAEISLRRILDHLQYRPTLVRGDPWRGHCPLHDPQAADDRRCFSAHLGRHIYRCFHCDSRGNILDFWMALHQLPLHLAVQNLCATLQWPIPILRNSQIPPSGTTTSATNGPR